MTDPVEEVTEIFAAHGVWTDDLEETKARHPSGKPAPLRVVRAELCPSCGGAISVAGYCRCSGLG